MRKYPVSSLKRSIESEKKIGLGIKREDAQLQGKKKIKKRNSIRGGGAIGSGSFGNHWRKQKRTEKRPEDGGRYLPE